MLSKHKITRQIPLTTTYYDATKVVSDPGTYAYTFRPTAGQGMYTNANTTKGTMIPGILDQFFLFGGGNLIESINQAVSAAGGPHMVVLRDLGKTIYTQYWAINATGNYSKSTKGYFRLVQLISPTPIGANGWNGGTNGSTFGVTGYPLQINTSPLNSTGYLTFYIPVTIANIISAGATSTGAFAIAGGQM